MTTTRPLTLTRRQILQLQETGEVVIERKVNPQPKSCYQFIGWINGSFNDKDIGKAVFGIGPLPGSYNLIRYRSPFGATGQRFWVREAWIGYYTLTGPKLLEYAIDKTIDGIVYHAQSMPREYSRFELELITVTVINRDGWRWVGKFAKVTP